MFFDTGLEYDATREHIKFLEEKYSITIETAKPKKSIPKSCKEDGVPFLSKQISEYISRLQRHNFKWEDRPFDDLYKEYPKCKAALQWWCNEKGEGSHFNIVKKRWLKEFLVAHPPSFPIANKCCKYAKKDLSKDYEKKKNYDLVCVGLRKAEGGARSILKSCFEENENGVDKFRPLFWFKKEDKEVYKKYYNIELSKCYTEYGLERTGCIGCPFSPRWREEYEIAQKFEPQKAKGVYKIFEKSYNYLEEYEAFVKQIEEETGYMSYAEYLRNKRSDV